MKARTALQIEGLNKEIHELEREAYKSVARSDEEKRLIGLDRVLKMESTLWNEKMTPGDWNNYLYYSSIYFPSLQEGYQLSSD